jgi:hypothetical protein
LSGAPDPHAGLPVRRARWRMMAHFCAVLAHFCAVLSHPGENGA